MIIKLKNNKSNRKQSVNPNKSFKQFLSHADDNADVVLGAQRDCCLRQDFGDVFWEETFRLVLVMGNNV